MRLTIIALILLFFPLHGYAQQTPTGRWEGAIQINGMDLAIAVTFSDSSGKLRGTIDIPQQGARDLALENVRYERPNVHFELPAGMTTAVFNGTRARDSISGKFTQGTFEGTFGLHVASSKAAATEPPPPYKEEDVLFKNGDITLAGTLTLPPRGGKHPAVVMITGSGPQNRDEEVVGFKVFKLIADALTRKGVAVLRYDDRGVGGSTGQTMQSTTADFVADALAAVQYLKTRPDINTAQIGLSGHSEGGLVGPMAAAADHGIAFVVMLAGPSLRGDSVIIEQVKAIAGSRGIGKGDLERELQAERKFLTAVMTSGDLTGVRQDIIADLRKELAEMPPPQRASIKDTASYLNIRADQTLAMAYTPWFRYFVKLDPAQYLKQLRCPVLALFGELDTQIPPASHKPAMEQLLKESGDRDVTVSVIPKANHLFQQASTGSPAEYATLPRQFAPGFLDTLTGWVTKHVTIAH